MFKFSARQLYSRVFINVLNRNWYGCLLVKMQVFTQKRNPLTGSTEWDVQHEDYDYHQEIARSAFADMLHDTERNKKYQRALQLAIEQMHAKGKKANVLDIGTGTGLLSIMAAKCGADSIVACEAFKPMAECAAKILQQNGVANKITLIPKRSTDLTVGEDGDMKEKANILVTEVFDTELIGEGALSTFSHAHQFLLEEDCIVVPDSAVVYAQVVECPTLLKWNKLNDLADEDLDIILKTPQKMRDCAGSAAVHDLQLSQIPRNAFRELSEHLPVFYYDWSGKTPIDMKKRIKQQFTAISTGKAQMVFMWWELNMDVEGRICLSCAPWWSHPDADVQAEHPQDTIPWRDHWMQAVYYLPKEITVHKNQEYSLISCHDEYSLWFYVEDDIVSYKKHHRPICDCGVHMTYSRTHISYLNDGTRSKIFLKYLREEINKNSVVLDLNGSTFLGLAAAKMGAKIVYTVENLHINVGILRDYMEENSIGNVEIVADVDEDILKTVTHVICIPNFSSSILPWENLKFAYLLYKYRPHLQPHVGIMPESCEFWAMPVEFLHLYKIRVPLGKCEGIDMTVFDEVIERSRIISDQELEPHPLWEYPCWPRGTPRKLITLDFSELSKTYALDNTFGFHEDGTQGIESRTVNGFVVWAVWRVGRDELSAGPESKGPYVAGPQDERVRWDPHSRQAVRLLRAPHQIRADSQWSYQLACDLHKGQFDLHIDLVKSDT